MNKFKKGDILKLNQKGLLQCTGGKEFRLKFIQYDDYSEKFFDGEYISGNNKGNILNDFQIEYYELSHRKFPLSDIELLDCLKKNEEAYYVS